MHSIVIFGLHLTAMLERVGLWTRPGHKLHDQRVVPPRSPSFPVRRGLGFVPCNQSVRPGVAVAEATREAVAFAV